MTTIQEYFNLKHPTQESKKKAEYIKIISIGDREFEEVEGGELRLDNYPNLETIKIDGRRLKSPLTKLEIIDCPNLNLLSCSNNSELTKLIVSNCPKLETLECPYNQLGEEDLKINNCSQISELHLGNNQLTNLKLPFLVPEKITSLILSDNKFPSQDLSFLSEFINLKKLFVDNNSFVGSLEPLKNSRNLKDLFISNTDIDGGLEYLPSGIEGFYCNVDDRREKSEVKIIKDKLEKYDLPVKTRGNASSDWTNLLKEWVENHPEKMIIAQLNLFISSNNKEEWTKKLTDAFNKSPEFFFTSVAEKISKISTKKSSLKKEKQELEDEIESLKDEIELEREIHTKSMKNMDNFYQKNPRLDSETKQENEKLKKRIEELEKALESQNELVEQILEGNQKNIIHSN